MCRLGAGRFVPGSSRRIAMGKDVLVLKDIDVSLIDGADFVFDV